MNALTVLAKKEILPILLKDKVYESLIDLILEETELAYKANAPVYYLTTGVYKIKYVDNVREYNSEVIRNPEVVLLPSYLDYTHLKISNDNLSVGSDLLVIPMDYKILYVYDKYN